MKINNQFAIGDVVYLKTDTEQKPRIITAIKITQSNLSYEVTHCTYATWHYDFEMSQTKDYSILGS
jgi:hypothetical protein